jgi:hypothetical protein
MDVLQMPDPLLGRRLEPSPAKPPIRIEEEHPQDQFRSVTSVGAQR